jgi:hypothetical protein
VCAQISSSLGLPAGAARFTTWFAGLRFVDREGTAFELFAVEPLHGRFGGSHVGHLDKSKAFGATRVTVGNHIDLVHNSILLKELAEVMICCAKRKVPYKDIHAKVLFMVKKLETIARSSEQYAGVTTQEHYTGETAKST